jgi:hypothetical protein
VCHLKNGRGLCDWHVAYRNRIRTGLASGEMAHVSFEAPRPWIRKPGVFSRPFVIRRLRSDARI